MCLTVNKFRHWTGKAKIAKRDIPCYKILEYLYDDLRKSDEQFKDQFKTAIAWLEKQGAQKFAWSKEDEKMFERIIAASEAKYVLNQFEIDWLKSLKPQIQWKPTQEQ